MGIFGNDSSAPQPFGGAQNSSDAGQLPQSYIDDILATQSPAPSTPAPQAPAPAPTPNPAPAQNFTNYPTSVPQPIAQQTPPPPVQQAPLSQPPQNNQADHDLAHIKQEALQHLSPLVGHLDQSPEEKFHTTMMMLQATDDQNLVRSAFEAAKAIPDDKARAQALMDVVNEINYFTQNDQSHV